MCQSLKQREAHERRHAYDRGHCHSRGDSGGRLHAGDFYRPYCHRACTGCDDDRASTRGDAAGASCDASGPIVERMERSLIPLRAVG